MGGYQSISGNYIRIDNSGDSEGNFTAYAINEHNYIQYLTISKRNFSCSHYLVEVGQFRKKLNSTGKAT